MIVSSTDRGRVCQGLSRRWSAPPAAPGIDNRHEREPPAVAAIDDAQNGRYEAIA
jgi:hypothetical protein